jgi:hypothetical protein
MSWIEFRDPGADVVENACPFGCASFLVHIIVEMLLLIY